MITKYIYIYKIEFIKIILGNDFYKINIIRFFRSHTKSIINKFIYITVWFVLRASARMRQDIDHHAAGLRGGPRDLPGKSARRDPVLAFCT